jgi:UDP-N-acetylmuramoylalanine--D-glutamate ligase
MSFELTSPNLEETGVSTALAVPTPLEYAGRTVLIVGLGESGAATARWLAFKGAALVLADTRQEPPELRSLLNKLQLLDALAHQATRVEVKLGAFDEVLLKGVDVVAWSPGLSTEIDDSGIFFQAIKAAGIPIIGELDLFAQAISDLGQAGGYQPKVIAVTGTNGKTTTVRLIQHLCESAGKKVVAAGNISPSMLDALFDAMQAQALPDIWALELSSFQLSLTTAFIPSVATVLNLAQNHLDWHATEASYAAAKHKIFGNASVTRVVNRGQPPELNEAALGITLSFGIDQPSQIGEFGLVRDGGLMWLAQGLSEDGDALPPVPARTVNSMGQKLRPRKAVVAPEMVVKRLMPADALKIRGRHNHANALAALALCTAIGVPMAAMLHGLRTFAGEPHRCQLVAIVNDVEYYNDSKATTIAATVAALAGLDKPSWLIAGGKGKGQDFAMLAQAVKEHAKGVFLIGVDAGLIKDALRSTGVEMIHCTSLEDAVKNAYDRAKSNEVVLLSPACASLDMFKNYGARGQAFVAAVEALS